MWFHGDYYHISNICFDDSALTILEGDMFRNYGLTLLFTYGYLEQELNGDFVLEHKYFPL
jgi:hypothetical protein